MAQVVLDASAILALLFQEPGAARVLPLLPVAAVGAVNLTEVLSRLQDTGDSPIQAWTRIEDLHLEIIPFNREAARTAAVLRVATRSVGLSLGDRACLATAQGLGLPAVTADRRWAGLDIGVEIRLIR